MPAAAALARKIAGGCLLIEHPRFGGAGRWMPPESSKPEIGLLMPFGRYRGLPVEVMASDPNYLDWLRVQPWFCRDFPEHYAAVLGFLGDCGPSAA